jgi:peroxiredoxin
VNPLNGNKNSKEENIMAVQSTMLEIGTLAPDFTLPDTEGKMLSRDHFKGKKGLLVMFLSNHCPFVKHIRHELRNVAEEYQKKDVGVVAIMSNNVQTHPADSPAKMAEEAENIGYTFPYLYDETQLVARAYRAACTPDLFLFNNDFKLVYRGQFDGSRPGNQVPVTGIDLRKALDAMLAGEQVPENQIPSVGCNIKWKPGNEPDYFG